LLLSGDAGVGKSALIDAAAAYADSIEFTVLRATGAEFEAHLSFAGLHQVLYPVLKNLDLLDELQRQALESVFGRGRGAPGPE
jgi:predicted ATP-dependent serine protease